MGVNPEDIDWRTGPTLEQLDAMNARLAKLRAEAKEQERGYSFPGMDAPWFSPHPPFQVWHAHGYVCALSAGYVGVNGYVLLARGHPWLDLDLQSGEEDPRVPEPQVHGGITFGPHVTGWIGWDSGHGFDVWPWEQKEALLDLVSEHVRTMWLQNRQLELDGHVMPGAGMGDRYDRRWDVAQVVAETESLARQAADIMPAAPTTMLTKRRRTT